MLSEIENIIDFKAIVEPMHGWCTPEKAQRLYDLVKECDAQMTVELGVFGGRSLIPLALASLHKGSGYCFGIDTWNAGASIEGENSSDNNEWWKKINFPEIYNGCVNAIEEHGLNEVCGLIRLKSETVALMAADNIFDILHQDSNHSSEIILKELKRWSSKIKVGGYWIVDDVKWPETKEGYSRLPEFGFELFEDHADWAIYKKVK